MTQLQLLTIFKALQRSRLSRRIRKPTICICENKGAYQLRGNREADQRLCFRYTDSTICLLLKSQISSFYPASMNVQAGLCLTWSETQIVSVVSREGLNKTLEKELYRSRRTCSAKRNVRCGAGVSSTPYNTGFSDSRSSIEARSSCSV